MSSIRKHAIQMSKDEKEYLLSKAKNVENWRLTGHIKKRIEERGAVENVILETLLSGEIIEFHQKDGASRILIRGTKTYYKSVACIVYQFWGEAIITLYWNAANDHHRTLKEALYDETLDIVKVVRLEEELREVK